MVKQTHWVSYEPRIPRKKSSCSLQGIIRPSHTFTPLGEAFLGVPLWGSLKLRKLCMEILRIFKGFRNKENTCGTGTLLFLLMF